MFALASNFLLGLVYRIASNFYILAYQQYKTPAAADIQIPY